MSAKENADYTIWSAIIVFIIGIFIFLFMETDKGAMVNLQLTFCFTMLTPALILCVAILLYLIIAKMDEGNKNNLDNTLSADAEVPPSKTTRVKCPKCGSTEDFTNIKWPFETDCKKCGAHLKLK